MRIQPAPLATRTALAALRTVHDRECVTNGLEPIAREVLTDAQARHRAHAHTLADGFHLLRPTHPGFCSAALYRAHCREILDRIATGRPTRPATGPEIMIDLEHAPVTPWSVTAAALFLRVWKAAELPAIEDPRVFDYENGPTATLRVDILENEYRTRLAQSGRAIPPTQASDTQAP